MFNVKEMAVKYFFKVETVSNIPGRLRLKIVHYKKIPDDALEFEKYAVDLAAKIKGVKSVSFNPSIGTVLILYDKALTDSEKIIATIDRIKKTVLDNIEIINRADELGIDKTREILTEMLEKAL